MAEYRVIQSFTDLKDKNHIYHPGDAYPRAGVDAGIDRITSLAGYDNRFGHPLIELVPETAPSLPAEQAEEPVEESSAEPVGETLADPVIESTEEKPKPKRKRSKAK